MNLAELFCVKFGPTVEEPNGYMIKSYHERKIKMRSNVEHDVFNFFIRFADLHDFFINDLIQHEEYS